MICRHGINTHLVQHQGQLQKSRDVEERRQPRRASRAPSRQRSESASSNSNMDTFTADNSNQSVVIDLNSLTGNQVSFEIWSCIRSNYSACIFFQNFVITVPVVEQAVPATTTDGVGLYSIPEVFTPSSNPAYLGPENEMTPMRDTGDDGVDLHPDLLETGMDINAIDIDGIDAAIEALERQQARMQPESMDQVLKPGEK